MAVSKQVMTASLAPYHPDQAGLPWTMVHCVRLQRKIRILFRLYVRMQSRAAEQTQLCASAPPACRRWSGARRRYAALVCGTRQLTSHYEVYEKKGKGPNGKKASKRPCASPCAMCGVERAGLRVRCVYVPNFKACCIFLSVRYTLRVPAPAACLGWSGARRQCAAGPAPGRRSAPAASPPAAPRSAALSESVFA
jgi:hypothetical protein